MLVKQRSVRILSKCKRSGVQRDRGQDFVLHTLILRVRRKRRTKNCSFDVAMRRCKKIPADAKLLTVSLLWKKAILPPFLCSELQVVAARTFAFFFKGALHKSREKNLVRCFRKGGFLNSARKKACPLLRGQAPPRQLHL